MTNKNINIRHILPLLLLIAIGIAIALGIGKATGLLARAPLGGVAPSVLGLGRGVSLLHGVAEAGLLRGGLLDVAADHYAATGLGVEVQLDALGVRLLG